MKILADFHHSSLLRSLQLLFENRLGHELYRPIGMEWYTEGFWDIYPHPDTAKQFLDLDQAFKPSDGTPQLNQIHSSLVDGVYMCASPGAVSYHQACTLQYFKDTQFDVVIASVPQHIPLFKRLIELYQPKAKLVFQVGNNWAIHDMSVKNVLASVAPQSVPEGINALFYHQEIDLSIFTPAPNHASNRIYSFVNILQNTSGWDDFRELERCCSLIDFKSFGGQCRDGNMTGDQELADMMRAAMVIFHVKPGGDGFGHIIHNAYAVGRPIITRKSHYRGQLAESLMVPGTYFDLDQIPMQLLVHQLLRISNDELAAMGASAAHRFKDVVDYEREGRDIANWLDSLV